MARISFDKLRRLQQQARDILREPALPHSGEEIIHPAHQFAHFAALAWNSFVRNRCFVRAAALTYTTILALVPLLALAASVTTTFLTMDEAHLAKLISDGIIYVAPALGQKVDKEDTAISSLTIAQNLTEAIQKVNVKTLGVSSTLSLLFLAISLLSTIEDAFNDMWGVLRGRHWFSRIVQYWAVLTLAPILVGVAITLTGASQFEQTKAWIQHVPVLGNLVFIILPYIIWSIGCALFYLLMPNAKVNWKAALAGGVVAGCLLQLNNKLSVLYYSKVVTSYKVYGTLGVIPVFLVGLYFSWVILLLGGQVAYAVQNWRAYAQEKQAERISQRGREFAALRIMTLVGARFATGERPPGCSAVADLLGVPLRLVMKLCDLLAEARLLIQTAGDEPGLAPARPLNQISAHDILEALRATPGEDVMTADDAARQPVRGEFQAIQEAEQRVASTISLQVLVDRIRPAELVDQSPLPSPPSPSS